MLPCNKQFQKKIKNENFCPLLSSCVWISICNNSTKPAIAKISLGPAYMYISSAIVFKETVGGRLCSWKSKTDKYDNFGFCVCFLAPCFVIRELYITPVALEWCNFIMMVLNKTIRIIRDTISYRIVTLSVYIRQR